MGTATQNSLFDLLSVEDRDELQNMRQENFEYTPWGGSLPRRSCNFKFELSARPLEILIDEAARGNRIYELMMITRPGDVLHYLWMKIIEADTQVIEKLKEHLKYNHFFSSEIEALLSELPYLLFDKPFNLHPSITDEEPFASLWYCYRQKQSFPILFEIIQKAQLKLRMQDDFLLQKELARIDTHTHALDLLPGVARKTEITPDKRISEPSHMPIEILNLVKQLIQQDDVNSVYCYAQDFIFWRMVVSEQVRRAETRNLPPQKALYLCGTDSGYVVDEWAANWGGEIFIPYEGGQICDLFIKPHWFNFFEPQPHPDKFILGYYQDRRAHYVLADEDFGELHGASRTRYGDWTLYKSNFPYRPVRDDN